MILRRPPRDPDVEVLSDDDVRARIASGELLPLDGHTPIDKARVAELRRFVAARMRRERSRPR